MQEKMQQLLTLAQESAQVQFDVCLMCGREKGSNLFKRKTWKFQNQRYHELVREVKSHQVSLSEMTEKNQELYNLLRSYQNKNKELETNIGHLSYENSNLSNQIERLTVEFKEKTTENLRLSDSNIKLSADLKARKDTCRCGTSSTESPKVRLNLQLQIQNLRRERQERDQEVERLKERLRKAKSESDKLVKNALTDRERMHSETEELIEVVGKQKSQLLAMRAEIERKESEVLRTLETKNLAEMKCHQMEQGHGELEKRCATLSMKEER